MAEPARRPRWRTAPAQRQAAHTPRLTPCRPSPVGCHTLPLGTFISVGRSLDNAVDRVRMAEQLGYHSVYTTHLAGRDSLTVLAAYAQATESIRLGTGVLPIYSRTPVATAQQAVTIDEISGGRLTLGIGVSHQVARETGNATPPPGPVAEMREYAAPLRPMSRGEDPPEAQPSPPRSPSPGIEPRPDLPIYVAALSPKMLELAG